MSSVHVLRAVAGSGKTHWLVEQYVRLVVDSNPPADPNGVVVITFTEAAARELIDRVRERLTTIAGPAQLTPRAARAAQVLADLAAAPIGTIHSFARRLLLQNASVASVAFGVEVRDGLDPEVRAAMEVHLDESIASFAAEVGVEVRKLGRESTWRTVPLRRDAAGLLDEVSGALLREPAWVAVDAEILNEQVGNAWRELAEAQRPPSGVFTATEARHALAQVQQVLVGILDGEELAKRSAPVESKAAELDGKPDSVAVDQELRAPRLTGFLTKAIRTKALKAGLDQGVAANERIEKHNEALAAWQLRRAQAYAKVAGLTAVESFLWARSQGGSEWLLQDELLQRSLRLLLSDSDLAAALRDKYPIVLLDEAQDIDATQRELLLALAGPEGLTIVGDPQQSIYGFRGADHRTFDDLSHRLLGDVEPEHQVVTRRCAPVIVDAVNAAFAADPQHTQMQAHRVKAHGSVTLLNPVIVETTDPENPEKTLRPKASDFRIAQAAALADAVDAFLTGGQSAGTEECQPAARASDIAVLVPSRAPVPAIEAALAARGIPTVVRTSRDLARHPMAEGVVAALLAIVDPDDTRALLIALRSPLFAHTDAELTEHAYAAGPLTLWSAAPEGSEQHLVAESLATLRESRRRYTQHGPGAAVSALIDRCNVLATLAAADGSGWIEGWSHIRLLADAVTERWLAGVESDASFAAWLSGEVASAGRTNRSVLHEPDAVGVTITTVHQAKGLQWPIVAVAAFGIDDVSTPRLRLSPTDVYTHLDRTHSYQPDGAPLDSAPSEVSRLMYVAMTRAKDHLVVSTVAIQDRRIPAVAQAASMHSACEGLAHPDVSIVDVPVIPSAQATQDSPTLQPLPPPDAAREHPDSGITDAALSKVHTRLAAVAQQASKVVRREAPSDTAGPGQPALPRTQAAPATGPSVGPRLQPKRAAAVGDAVHAALERVDFALFTDPQVPLTEVAAVTSTPGFSDLSSIEQARAWAILERARSSPLLRRAALAEICRRELPISGQHEDGSELVVTQGSIDLLFAESAPDGQRRWILVDYKTDATSKPREEFAARYAGQLAAYRRLLADVGVTVAESWLVRLTETTVSDIEVVP